MKGISQIGFTPTEFRKPFPSRRSEQCFRLMQFVLKLLSIQNSSLTRMIGFTFLSLFMLYVQYSPFFFTLDPPFERIFVLLFFLLYNLSETFLCALLTPHTNPIPTSQHSLNYSRFSVRELQCNNQSSNHSIHWTLLNLLMKKMQKEN